ncbi:uracil-DNA glycosylase family protein [Streptococcus cuniculi]|uniref:Uracil-DNA glycosylase family protein n=1 Tax=Streptococcus cuniculi TaxID=1432788 RepID=A0A4Y9J899_9STRE|nr:uracil-DNA glycosylase family protein [Streptococcus cuniculi]MBF0778937.1 uracil-DNA glycosylase family protein [Streptococcus cuniculi]TFU97092.1 uracil-DNA glycosylase family protein [Streptococcus cuniculi]
MTSLATIRAAIMADPANRTYTEQGLQPLFQADCRAKILIVGQAPGVKAQERQQLFADPSGDNLRAWLGVDTETFYDANQLAILPMDFYYPGKGKSSDLPPRKGFAQRWHSQLLANLPRLELTLLIGQYAQEYYLKDRRKRTLTETVQAYEEYLPQYLPLVHPSPRNNIWQAKNPWFRTNLVLKLQEKVSQILDK